MTCRYDVQHHLDRRDGAARGQAIAGHGEAVGADIDVGEADGEIIQIFPMGRGSVAIQKASLGQQPRSAINPGHGCASACDTAQPGQQAGGGVAGQLEPGNNDHQVAAVQPGQWSARDLQRAGQHCRVRCCGHVVPVKGRSVRQPVRRAHRIDSRGKAERVAFVQHQHSCLKGAMFWFQDVFCGFHQVRFAFWQVFFRGCVRLARNANR